MPGGYVAATEPRQGFGKHRFQLLRGEAIAFVSALLEHRLFLIRPPFFSCAVWRGYSGWRVSWHSRRA